MPTYDYECRNCGHRVEVLHGVNETGPTACGQCGGPMRKLLSTPTFVFKGSGWAKKDARDARPQAKADGAATKTESSGSSGESSGESSTGSEAKPKGESTAPAKSGDGGGGATGGKKESSTSTPSAD